MTIEQLEKGQEILSKINNLEEILTEILSFDGYKLTITLPNNKSLLSCIGDCISSELCTLKIDLAEL